jgi:hypothetical protein
MKKALSLILTTVMLFTMSGCSILKKVDEGGRDEPQLVHYLHSGDGLTLRYFDELDYTRIEYEEIAYQSNDRLAVGPTEPWYAGVLYLTEEEADRLWDEYEWEECGFPDIELYDIEVPQTDSNLWCSSADFNQYIEDQAVQVIDIAFDGSVIVFYLKTF